MLTEITYIAIGKSFKYNSKTRFWWAQHLQLKTLNPVLSEWLPINDSLHFSSVIVPAFLSKRSVFLHSFCSLLGCLTLFLFLGFISSSSLCLVLDWTCSKDFTLALPFFLRIVCVDWHQEGVILPSGRLPFDCLLLVHGAWMFLIPPSERAAETLQTWSFP
jgi:hypothetical protein